MTEFLDWLADAADRRAARGLTRRLHTTKPGDLLDLAGNDYLGLRTDPRVIAAAVAAVESHGGGSGASRLVTGTLPVHDDLEATLAGLLGSPAALVLSTGYAANLAALTTLTDADTLVWTVGFFTAGLSFAAGPVVGDLLSGASIIFQDKLVVGEKIRINSQFVQIEGIVERINLKSTQLRARTGEMYIVNNGELRYICNFSRGPYSATSLRIKIAATDLLPALALLNRLAPEAPRLFTELNEPWLVFSESGTMDHTTELTLALKTDFGRAAQLRPKLMVFLQHHFAMEKITFAK